MSMFRILVLIFSLCLAACNPQAEIEHDPTPQIVVDQFGYKRAIIRSPEIGYDAAQDFTPSRRYAVIDVASGETVFEGTPVAWNEGLIDTMSGDKVWWFDFSALKTEGSYKVVDLETFGSRARSTGAALQCQRRCFYRARPARRVV